jgi:hypothetical protein
VEELKKGKKLALNRLNKRQTHTRPVEQQQRPSTANPAGGGRHWRSTAASSWTTKAVLREII